MKSAMLQVNDSVQRKRDRIRQKPFVPGGSVLDYGDNLGQKRDGDWCCARHIVEFQTVDLAYALHEMLCFPTANPIALCLVSAVAQRVAIVHVGAIVQSTTSVEFRTLRATEREGVLRCVVPEATGVSKTSGKANIRKLIHFKETSALSPKRPTRTITPSA